MSVGLLIVAIALGAGVIALWLDHRFPRLAPQDLAKAVLHIAASLAVVYASGPAMQMMASSDDQRIVLLGVFAIGFTSVVYCLLAGFWLIKLAQQMLSGNLR